MHHDPGDGRRAMCDAARMSSHGPSSPSVASEGDPTAAAAARLLALILERSPRPLAELARAAGLAETAAAPIVTALERHGLVAWGGGAGLRPGPALLRFARSDAGRQDLIELAQPSLRRLASESGETVNLMVPTPTGSEAIAQLASSHLLGATNWLGRPVPLHCSAAGKVFLAYGVAALGDGPLESRTPATVVDPAALERELEQVRARGYGTTVDELEPGLSAVAAPVFERGGTVVGALALSGASLRLTPHRLGLLGRVCIEQAHGVSVRLGHEVALEDVLRD
jgi:IclR family transcriptional regulator, acetate operon repressor